MLQTSWKDHFQTGGLSIQAARPDPSLPDQCWCEKVNISTHMFGEGLKNPNQGFWPSRGVPHRPSPHRGKRPAKKFTEITAKGGTPPNPGPLKWPPRPPWGGGTQLLEGTLTGATTRFCRELSKYRDYALFFGVKFLNVPHATFQDLAQMCPWDILRFESNMPPLKPRIWLKCAPSNI